MTLKALLTSIKNKLDENGMENSESEARELVAFGLKLPKDNLFFHYADTVSENEIPQIEGLVQKRLNREPLQYIIGEWDFYGRSYFVGTGVLIPRPETEQLTEDCIDCINDNGYQTVFDLCAGSGCIGITVALQLPQTQVWLFEKYPDALEYLNKNIPEDIHSRIHVVPYDIFNGYRDEFPKPDMIISNPPYVTTDEMKSLQAEVRFEPCTALDGGADGLDFYRGIAEKWLPFMNQFGTCAVEVGEGQAKSVKVMFSKFGVTTVKTDFSLTERFVYVHKTK